ncbi:hypothetical protein J1N35_025472 [Gossypium stocksii]|uniref:Uncharacterized protein n=1 Tax=Gossypium stocksii TaxID=47602 RepID=A0A9D3ZXV6_9ROSI|nr:hypothetical protein J1N35_025472 [Gossypium stocksii]
MVKGEHSDSQNLSKVLSVYFLRLTLLSVTFPFNYLTNHPLSLHPVLMDLLQSSSPSSSSTSVYLFAASPFSTKEPFTRTLVHLSVCFCIDFRQALYLVGARSRARRV